MQPVTRDALLRPGSASARAHLPRIDASVLDQSCEQMLTRQERRFRPIAFLTAYDSPGRKLCSWLEELGVVVMIITDRHIPLDWIANRDGKLECLVIDESYAGADIAASLTSRFMKAAPSIPVVRLARSPLAYIGSAGPVPDIDPASGAGGNIIYLPVTRTALKLGVLCAINRIPLEDCAGVNTRPEPTLESLGPLSVGFHGLKRSISSFLERWR